MPKYKCSSCGSEKSVRAGGEASICCDKTTKEARDPSAGSGQGKEDSGGCGCCG